MVRQSRKSPEKSPLDELTIPTVDDVWGKSGKPDKAKIQLLVERQRAAREVFLSKEEEKNE